MYFNPYSYNQTAYPQQFENTQQPNQMQQMVMNGQFGQNMPVSAGTIQVGNNMYDNIYNQPMYYQEPNLNYGNIQLNNPICQQQFDAYNNQIGYNQVQQQYYGNQYPYQQQQYYDYNKYPQYLGYQEPKSNYYDPWNTNSYLSPLNGGYDNQYYYNNFAPYNGQHLSRYEIEDIRKQREDELNYGYKVILRMCSSYNNLGWSEDKIEEMVNPKPQQIEITKEMMDEQARLRNAAYLHRIVHSPKPDINNCSILRNHYNTMKKYEEFHKSYDRHSMYEFLCEDLPEILYGFWLEDMVAPDITRDHSTLYNSNSYNELLRMHAQQDYEKNKYAYDYQEQLLNNKRYDDYSDVGLKGNDLAFEKPDTGIKLALNIARLRRQLAEGNLSDPEIEKNREIMTQQIVDQINEKKKNKKVM